MGSRLERAVSAYLDTNVAVWLHAGELNKLSIAAKRTIESSDLLLSPTVLVELQYLFGAKRISVPPMDLYTYLNVTFSIDLCPFPFAMIARESLAFEWTPDPFDRLITAHAKANHDSALITSDRLIREHYPRAIW